MAGFWLYCLVDVALTPGDEKGPDDDPKFLSSLNRAIHGAQSAEAGDDPAGWSGEEC